MLKILLTNRYVQAIGLIAVILFCLNWWKDGAVKDAVSTVYDKIESQVNELLNEDQSNVQDAINNLPHDVFSGVQPESSNEDRQVGNARNSQAEANLLPEDRYEVRVQEIGEIRSGAGLSDTGLLRRPDTQALHQGQGINEMNPCYGIPDCFSDD